MSEYKMKPKERVLNAINREETDRMPFGFPGYAQLTQERLFKKFNLSTHEEILKYFDVDTRLIEPARYTGEQRYFDGEPADAFGLTGSIYTYGHQNGKCPLQDVASIDDVESYYWPSPDDFSTDHIQEQLELFGDYATIADIWATTYHIVAWLCGIENTLVNMISQPEVSKAIIRHVTDFYIGCIKKTLEAGKGKITIANCGIDFGTQNGLIMSPSLFREFYKPEMKRLFDTMKEYDAKVFFHSCGSVAPIIPDLIEIGVDILDPIQVSAYGMNPVLLKEKYGDKLTFHGGIDTQHLLPEGTVDEVKHEVNRVLSILSKGGGYILSGSQSFESDIPIENIIAVYDEAKKIKYIK